MILTKGSLSAKLTSCLSGLDSAALLLFNQQQIYLFGKIQTCLIGGQPYSDTSHYKVTECCLVQLTDWAGFLPPSTKVFHEVGKYLEVAAVKKNVKKKLFFLSLKVVV